MAKTYTTKAHYISIRIQLDHDANGEAVAEAAETLKDKLYDMADEDGSPLAGFVRDVTYEVIREVIEEDK